MVAPVLRRSRRRAVERMAVAAAEYAAMGWPVCLGASPPGRAQRHEEMLRACSCDRIGCPAPGAHPMSPAWQVQATADPALVERWWTDRPQANVILAPRTTVHVLDGPAAPRPAGPAPLG